MRAASALPRRSSPQWRNGNWKRHAFSPFRIVARLTLKASRGKPTFAHHEHSVRDAEIGRVNAHVLLRQFPQRTRNYDLSMRERIKTPLR